MVSRSVGVADMESMFEGLYEDTQHRPLQQQSASFLARGTPPPPNVADQISRPSETASRADSREVQAAPESSIDGPDQRPAAEQQDSPTTSWSGLSLAGRRKRLGKLTGQTHTGPGSGADSPFTLQARGM